MRENSFMRGILPWTLCGLQTLISEPSFGEQIRRLRDVDGVKIELIQTAAGWASRGCAAQLKECFHRLPAPPAADEVYPPSLASRVCQQVRGKSLTAFDQENNEYALCVLAPGKIIDAWSLVHFQEKPL